MSEVRADRDREFICRSANYIMPYEEFNKPKLRFSVLICCYLFPRATSKIVFDFFAAGVKYDDVNAIGAQLTIL